MDSSDNTEVALKIFSVFFSFGFCCLLFSCCGYILFKKNNMKQNQIHFTNHRHISEAHAHIFTVDVSDIQSPNTTITGPSHSHLFEKPPPPYESIEEPLSVAQHQSNVQV